MAQRRFFAFLFIVAAVLMLSCRAQATVTTSTASSALFDQARMMRVQDIRPGMKGYGLTVFSGTEPEKFEAEVVGVRHRSFPGDDMILCRLQHPLLQDIGVVAGMSGSPVYIEGKLIGAVAYGWTFSKEPLAGVTPIEPMLRVMEATKSDLRDPDDIAGDATLFEKYCQMRSTLQLPMLRTDAPAARVVASRTEFSLAEGASLPENFELEPLMAPLWTTASSPLARSLLRSLFPQSAVYSATNGAAAGDASQDGARLASNTPGGPVGNLDELAQRLSGGYALAVPLLEGDLALAGVGTVTYREGDKLVAFGHPMFGFGVVRYPMAPARIHSIVRSIMRPFKLGESLGTIGVIRQDRLPAVGGLIGEQGRSFTIHVEVTDEEYRGHREFNFRGWRDRQYAPTLVMLALTESLAAAGRYGGETAVAFRYGFQLDDGTTLTKEDYFVDTSGGGMAGIVVGSELGMLTTNPFKKVLPEHVDFQATLRPRYPLAQLRSIATDKRAYRPGETVRLFCELLPYRRDVERKTLAISLPADLAEGEYELVVCDAQGREALDGQRNPALREIRDYESLLRRLRTYYPQNRLYVALVDRDTGAAVRGQELPRLPSSIITTIASSTESSHFSPVRGNIVAQLAEPMPWEISGHQRLVVKITKSPKER